jgi:hypothetical protein
VEALTAEGQELGNITLLDKETLLEEALNDKAAAEGSATAAIVEATAEGVTTEMLAGLFQEKWLAQMATDVAAKAEAKEAAAAAAAEPPADGETAEAPAPKDGPAPADRVFLFVNWPQTAEEITALGVRGVKLNGAVHLANTPVPGEDGALPEPAGPHALLTSVQEGKKGPVTDVEAPLVDFVWSELTVPPAPPPPAEDAEPPPEDAPVEPTPGEVARDVLKAR